MPKQDAIKKNEAEWKKELTPEQYEVLRRKGTEPAFTGKYWDNHDSGKYLCAGCGAELFSSDTKFDSGTGWPSFTATQAQERVHTVADDSGGMKRVEVTCSRCGSHLGHVFDDGPKKLPDGRACDGKRFCINSVALKFNK